MTKEKVQTIINKMVACLNPNTLDLFYSVLRNCKENEGMFIITIEGNMNWNLYETIQCEIKLDYPTESETYDNVLFNEKELIEEYI